MCRMFAFSTAKAYKVLEESGWDSGRRKRKDAGTTSVDQKLLATVHAMSRQGTRKNGKSGAPVNVLRSILEARGVTVPVSDSRLRELLRQNHMAAADSKVPSPHQSMKTEYPNQVHQADPSVSLLYYAPRGGQKIISGSEHYKNKDFFKDGKKKCLRYVLTDHYSGSVCARYYEEAGETAANMYDFLLYAWGRKQYNAYVFHGLPELLIWDCGTANIARATTNALKALGVKTIPHLPRNPRAKGQVEGGNGLVERQFESRLRFEPVRSVDELNEAVERWCAAYNANLITGLDTRLHRNGIVLSRSTLWQRIRPERLRELPDAETCRQIFANGVQTRKVAGNLSVSIVHPRAGRSLKYSVRDLPGILVGMDVQLQPVLVTAEADFPCIVFYEHEGSEVSFELKPVVFDDAGFDVTAPVFGKQYKRPGDTGREKQAKAAELIAGSLAGPAHSFIRPENPFMRQSEGTPVEVAETVHTHELIISAVEAAKRMKAECGEVPDGFIGSLREQYPEGVPVRAVDDLIKARTPKREPAGTTGGLVIQGGAAPAGETEETPAPAKESKTA